MAGLDKSIDTIVNVSGGAECFAALWWAKERGLNAVGLHLYNNPNNELTKDAALHYAKKQCEFFKFPLVIDRNELPQEITLGLAVNQHMSAAATLLIGNPRKWKYLVWGANADDSFQQRLLLRYPIRAYFAQMSYQLDLHGVAAQHVLEAPINIFPFETLHKSEIISMLAKNLWDFAKKNIWYCHPIQNQVYLEEKIKHNPDGSYTPCGECIKCIEWKNAVQVANKSVYKQQEGTFKKKKPKQQWIDEK